jgi:Gpi18-like mannosyltransferase
MLASGQHWLKTLLLRIPPWTLRDVVAPLIATRLMLVMVAWLGFHLVPRPVTAEGTWELSKDGRQAPIAGVVSADVHPFVNMWSRWDATWYLDIAEHGYKFRIDAPSNASFYPMYPLLMRAAHRVLAMPRNDAGWLLAGLIVSNLAFIAALIYLVFLIRLDFDESTAARSVLYLLVFPTTFFFSAVFSESLFLALVVSAIYYARRNRWVVAGVLGAGAAICRPPGFLILLPLAVEYLQQKRFQLRAIKVDALALALIPLALAGFATFLRFRFGSWQVLFDSHAYWSRGFTWQTETVWQFFHTPHHLGPNDNSPLDLLFSLFFLILTVLVCLRLRLSYGIYTAASIFFVTLWGLPGSIARYALVIFPFAIVLGLLGRNDYFHRSFLIISLGLAAFFMVIFSQWGWVA